MVLRNEAWPSQTGRALDHPPLTLLDLNGQESIYLSKGECFEKNL